MQKKRQSPRSIPGLLRINWEQSKRQQAGGTTVKGLPEERTIRLAQYMIEENATVRQTAARFGVSKSTVHKDITTRLKTLNAVLYERVQEVLRTNKQERHIRGGMATREKYRVQAEERRHGGAIKNRLSAGQPGDGTAR